MFTLKCTVFTLSPGHHLLNATLQQLYTKKSVVVLHITLLTLQVSVQETGKSAAKLRATAKLGHLMREKQLKFE